ncbi:uncharacterized protein LOC126825266 isoform X2 [Patella vulgata]|uniref:uncharacterized protein LOC126825266 isoform X2 n=1 Tax=Patella vulgata TaxID=6465 RepID=UPI0021808E26|nr:uncharacterized protein LOC126825266 isoform X2 [Patella vulgata]
MQATHENQTEKLIDETSCGAFCQHPACWQSNQRREKGFPLKTDEEFTQRKPVTAGTSLPELVVYNLIEDYGEDSRDRFPAKHSGHSSEQRPEQRHEPFPALTFPTKALGHLASSPLPTPESVVKPAKKKSPPKMKVVEVQELFDVEDLESRWDETFITKQCYVWVPSPNRKPPPEPDTELKMITDGTKSGSQLIRTKDVTEQCVPEELEREREELRMKRQSTRCRSPISRGRNTGKSSSYPHRSAFDSDGINDLLSLPRDLLMQVLDHLKDSDLMSQDRINNVIQDFQPPLVRDLTGISIGTAEALQQKKMALLRDKKRNIRESHLMESRPIFQLDDGLLIDHMSRVNTPGNESDIQSREISLSIQGFSRHKKPLPAIRRLKAVGSGKKTSSKSKVASISLGLPELPTGIKHTRPFTYKKSDTMDLSIGPMPTPPTSVRSSVTAGSDHGTTMNVNLTSPTDSYRQQELDVRIPATPGSPYNLPKAPVCTPATNKDRSFIRDKTESSLKNLDSRDHVLVPVNSPSNSECENPNDQSGLKTIPEMSARETLESLVNTERQQYREVTDVPPVPTPPPSTIEYQQEDGTLTKIIQKPTESVEDTESQAKTYLEPCIESPAVEGFINNVSTYSSPDPWPQVNEASYANSEETDPKDEIVNSRSDLHSRESEQDLLVRKLMDERIKGTSPAPPPPSPEGKEFDRILSLKVISRESAAMDPLMEEENEETPRGEENESEKDTSEARVVTVSEVGPNPHSLIKEKSFHSFVNVDIPAESVRDQVQSDDPERPKLERTVQSFVSIDIPAANKLDVSILDPGSQDEPKLPQVSGPPTPDEQTEQEKQPEKQPKNKEASAQDTGASEMKDEDEEEDNQRGTEDPDGTSN